MKSDFTVGIIGGNGQMGKSLIDFFKRNGIKVIFSDINTEISNKEVAKNSDIIILAIPLKCYEDVLDEIYEFLTQNKLLMDIGSLKEEQAKLMKSYHSGEILLTHPLFGPEKEFKGNENSIIICKINSGEKTDFLINLFKNEGLNIVETSPEEHDEIMAYIHGFYYLMNITYIDVLREKFGEISKIENIMTTSFQKYISGLENIFNTKDWLIELIAYENRYIEKVAERFKEKLKEKVNLREVREFLGKDSLECGVRNYLIVKCE